jgi:hypothetical protein
VLIIEIEIDTTIQISMKNRGNQVSVKGSLGPIPGTRSASQLQLD